MNHRPSQSRLTFRRSHAAISRIGVGACSTAMAMQRTSRVARAGGASITPPALLAPSAVEPCCLALGDLDRALGIFAAGADVGEHVEDDEIGKRRGCLLADRAQSA